MKMDLLDSFMLCFVLLCLILGIDLVAKKLDIHVLIVIQHVIYIGVLGMGGFIVGQWDLKNTDDNFSRR